jgi:hypothetical protein
MVVREYGCVGDSMRPGGGAECGARGYLPTRGGARGAAERDGGRSLPTRLGADTRDEVRGRGDAVDLFQGILNMKIG